ncbi:Hypothetical Protein FCC1311_074052 [Hondaea fermentalgiana]|uniref:Prominin-1-A n=1 Tax=Hondaea fermentalgiana TaxID=2315210 RepID=A0A2R5GTH1_9STRA|nr:Hypothetical Protein FCC1311_074052 [Hondaea fermentalgiana]|eukprot:GBG31184.1 Hypothetical Protein FCC1311_074052 [Hondaea fermentalgiana]
MPRARVIGALAVLAAAAAVGPQPALASDLKACRGDNNDLNDVLGIPRVNMAMQSVSRDLGQYASPLTVCETAGVMDICSADWLEDLQSEGAEIVVDGDYASANEESWVNYIQSLIIYVGIGFFFALVTVIAGLVTLCGNCCGCCKCCYRQPEFKDGEVVYPRWQIVTMYFCLFFFFLLVFTFMMLILVRGNMGLMKAQYALVDAPDELATLTASVSSPVISLATSLIGTTAVNLITRVNETLFDVGELGQVHESISCAREVFEDITDPTLLSNVTGVLDEISAVIDSLPTQTDVDNVIDGVLADLTTLTDAVSSTSTEVTEFQNGVNTILGYGIDDQVSSIQTDLTTIDTQLSSVGSGLDSLIGLRDSATALQATITPLIDSGNTAYTAAQVEAFETAYETFKTDLNGLDPDEADLKASINALDVSLNSMEASLDQLDTDLTNVQNTVTNDMSLTNLTNGLDAIINATDNFDFSDLQSELNSTLALFDSLPDVQPIVDTINHVIALQSQIPCIFEIADVPQTINDRLVELPASLLNATSELQTLNQTFYDATSELPTLLDDIDTFSASFNGTGQAINDEFDAQLAVVLDKLNATRAAIVTLRDEVTAMDDPIIDVSGALTTVNTLRNSITNGNLRPSATTDSSLDDAANARSTLITSIDTLDATSFPDDVEAVGDTVGSWTCKDSSITCYNYGSSGYAACTSGAFCDYPYEYWSSLSDSLDEFVTGFNAINPGLDDMKAQVENAQESVSDIDLSCCTDFSEIETAATELSDSSAALSDATSSTDDLEAEIEGLRDEFSELLSSKTNFESIISDVETTIDDINNTITSFSDTGIEEIFDMELNVYELLTVNLGGILQEISTARLDAIAAGPTGVEDLVMHVAEQLDLAIAAVEPSQAVLASEAASIMNYVRALDTSRDVDGALREVGSIYYLAQTAIAAQDDSSIAVESAAFFESYDTPSVYGPITGSGIGTYPGDVMCVTDECIRNTIDYYNNNKLSDVVPSEFSEAVPIPLGVSRHTITAVPAIVPAILLVMTICICFWPSCGNWLGCCSVCVAPWLFAIFGAIIFPNLIVVADVCASAESVGKTVMTELQPYLCEQINGTITAGGFCEVYMDVPPVAKTVELDLPQLVLSLLDDCSGSSLANVEGAEAAEPVAALYASFGLEAGIIVQNQLANLLDEILPGMGVVLRADLRDDVEASGADLQNDVTNFADNLEGVLGCDDFSAAYLGFKETFCCDFGQAFYWSFAGWYLLAFCMLLLGFPVGCCAARRLHNLKHSRDELRGFYRDGSQALADSRVGTAVANSRVGSAVANTRLGRAVFIASPQNESEAGASVAPYATVYEEGDPEARPGESNPKSSRWDKAKNMMNRAKTAVRRPGRSGESDQGIAPSESVTGMASKDDE